MRFQQHDDGSVDIIFEKHEAEIITKKSKLHLDPMSLKHFGNALVRIVISWQELLPKEVQNITSNDYSEINGSDPKDDS